MLRLAKETSLNIDGLVGNYADDTRRMIWRKYADRLAAWGKQFR